MYCTCVNVCTLVYICVLYVHMSLHTHVGMHCMYTYCMHVRMSVCLHVLIPQRLAKSSGPAKVTRAASTSFQLERLAARAISAQLRLTTADMSWGVGGWGKTWAGRTGVRKEGCVQGIEEGERVIRVHMHVRGLHTHDTKEYKSRHPQLIKYLSIPSHFH